MQKSLDEDRTSDAAEQDEFDNLSAQVEAIDKDLVRLRAIEKIAAAAAGRQGHGEARSVSPSNAFRLEAVPVPPTTHM